MRSIWIARDVSAPNLPSPMEYTVFLDRPVQDGRGYWNVSTKRTPPDRQEVFNRFAQRLLGDVTLKPGEGQRIDLED